MLGKYWPGYGNIATGCGCLTAQPMTLAV